MEVLKTQKKDFSSGNCLDPPEKQHGGAHNSSEVKHPGNKKNIQKPGLGRIWGKQGLKSLKRGRPRRVKTLEQIGKGQKKSSNIESVGIKPNPSKESNEDLAELATFLEHVYIQVEEITQTQCESEVQPEFLRPD